MSLFEVIKNENVPLADKLRPQDFDEMVGQEHLLGEDGIISNFTKTGFLPSLILWGVPGCGKTTLANIIANKSGRHLEILSAITSGVADLKKIFADAEVRKKDGVETLLFVDEIHRFNRAQQDVFLPFIEKGVITLIGATTENPSFELNGALLSRCKVLVLNRLDEAALGRLIEKAEKFYGRKIPLNEDAKNTLCSLADGDGRVMLNMVEEIFALPKNQKELDIEGLIKIVQKRAPLYDKSQDGHYNLISALHKSLRGSDVDAALYWLSRMLDGGENPIYILRRLIRFASEDIGMADPNALTLGIAAKDSYEMLGSPEGELAIFQLTAYLATAPKSNSIYTASKKAMRAAKEHGSLMPPKHILNAPTKLMQEEGYGHNYQYDHDTAEGFSGQNYFPDEMKRQNFYKPFERGFEREIIKRLDYWEKLRNKKD
jgi:putative ATPase